MDEYPKPFTDKISMRTTTDIIKDNAQNLGPNHIFKKPLDSL